MDEERLNGGAAEGDLSHVLNLVQAGLDRAGATITSMLGAIVDQNAVLLAELESALSDAEAALLPD